MEGLRLLARAHAAGLTVQAAGNELIIHGPKFADRIARELLENKPAVLSALRCVLRLDAAGRMGLEPGDLPEGDRWWAGADFESLPQPSDPCPRCGSLEVWWDCLNGEHC